MQDWEMKADLLNEENYQAWMDSAAAVRLEQCRQEYDFNRPDGQRLHVTVYSPEKAQGVVLISHGFSEAALKYSETAYYLLQAGYQVWIPDHCGHGASSRMVEDPCAIYIDDFQRYVQDLLFVARQARLAQYHLPLYLFGHSMGGGIAILCAQKDPELFSALILNAPMIRPKTGSVRWPAARDIAWSMCAFGFGNQYLPGQKAYEHESFEQSAGTSPQRFAWYAAKRDADPALQTCAATYKWLKEASRVEDWIYEGISRLTMPVLIFEAGHEDFVSNKALEAFVKALRKYTTVRLVKVPDAKHEIFSSSNAILEGYWTKIFDFLQSVSKRH